MDDVRCRVHVLSAHTVCVLCAKSWPCFMIMDLAGGDVC